jgi:hypothetical protein
VTTRIAVLLAAACWSSPLAAQAFPPLFGVGVDQTARLTVVVAAAPAVRLQPEVAYQRVSFQNASLSGGRQVTSNLRAGLGLFVVRRLSLPSGEQPVLIYAGPRAGVVLQHGSIDSASADQTDWWIGAALGGEYFFGRHLSLGAEAQVTKAFPGTATGGGGPPYYVFATAEVQTQGLLMIRVYPF